MADIILSASVRENLLALQKTADLQSLTQNRLSTGKKVNSALDNPNAFFTAEGLDFRAKDLTSLLDDMGQSVQTLRAAEKGINAILKLVESAKAKANQAFQSQSQHDRKNFAEGYNGLLEQIEDLAKDSGYLGKNLLGGAGNDLTVYFNEDNSSKLNIEAIDYTDTTVKTGLNLQDLNTGTTLTSTLALTAGSSTAAALTAGATIVTDNDFNAGDVLSFTDGNGYNVGSFEITSTTTVQNLVDFLNGAGGLSGAVGATGVDITSEVDLTVARTADGAASSTSMVTIGNGTNDSDFASDTTIRNTLTSITNALNALRNQASTFGTNLTVVENRESFTKDFVNTLKLGSGMLVLADSNQEGANLLALNTRQQLSSTSLSFASQADQAVLRLFG